jgi:hypothetical protein
MDWEALRERTLGEVGTTLATEGIGVAGGLVGASFVGRQIERVVMGKAQGEATVASTDPLTTKIYAWAANNVPKLAGWYLLRNYARIEPGEMVTPTKEITVDAKKAFAGSFVFDTLIRLSNHGVPVGPVSFMGIDWLGEDAKQAQTQSTALQADMQRLIQENSALRSELNKALQRIASGPAIAPAQQVVQTAPIPPQATVQPVVHTAPAPAPAPIVRYQPAQAAPAPVVRPAQAAPTVTYTEQRPMAVRRAEEVPPVAYAQPVPPAVSERERKYGFMQFDITPPAVQELINKKLIKTKS